MKEPIWLSAADIYGIHQAVIAASGGQPGILAAGSITASLHKAKNVFHYSQTQDLRDLAAVYAYAFIKNHCFVEANERVALIVVYTFLAINGVELNAPPAEAARLFREISMGQAPQVGEIEKISRWLKRYS